MPQLPTFLDNIKSTLSAPLFTADLKNGKPGSYDFGFIDDSKYTGNITYVPVDSRQGFWGFTVNGYAIDTKEFNPVTVNGIADTGSTLISLPEKIVNAYYAAISGAVYSSTEAGFVYPCGTPLPSITFDIGNYRAVVPGSFIEYRPISEDSISMFHQISNQLPRTTLTSNIILACFGGIQSTSDFGFILGDIFLKSQFVVFDAGTEPRLGFAAKPL